MRARVLVAVAVAAMLVASATTVAGGSVTEKKKVACDLITPDDIATVLGLPGAVLSTQGPTQTAAHCAYDLPAPGGGISGTLDVGLGKYDASVKRDLPKNSKAPGAKKIPGLKLGYYALGGNQGAGNIAETVKGDKTFITIQVFSDGVTKDQLVKLIKTAYRRA
jgi:hypothetical protein